MGWFFRKRIRIARGVHLNIGKKSASITAGSRGIGFRLPLLGRRGQNSARRTEAEIQAQTREPTRQQDEERSERPATLVDLAAACLLVGLIGWGGYRAIEWMFSRGLGQPAPAVAQPPVQQPAREETSEDHASIPLSSSESQKHPIVREPSNADETTPADAVSQSESRSEDELARREQVATAKLKNARQLRSVQLACKWMREIIAEYPETAAAAEAAKALAVLE